MSTQVQQLRGTTAENDVFTGKSGVLTVDTEKKDIRVHDGVKQGGYSIIDRVQQLQQDNRVLTGNVTINNTDKTTSISFLDQHKYLNPTIRMDRTTEDGNFCDLAFVGSSFNIYLNKFGDVAKFYDDGTTSFAKAINIQGKTYLGEDGNIIGSAWESNSLWQHIENRFRCSVTDSRVTGWVDVRTPPSPEVGYMPAGYFVAGTYYESHVGSLHICGRQPQLYIANRGWYSLGWW